MGKDDKIRMPSGQGGIMRYFDEYKSRFEISPTAVIVLCFVIMIVVLILHYVGKGWFV